MKDDKEQTQLELFMPPEWWSDIVRALDSKLRFISETYGYGATTLEIRIHDKNVKRLRFNDDVTINYKPGGNLTPKPKV
jgi:hypothetical protein